LTYVFKSKIKFFYRLTAAGASATRALLEIPLHWDQLIL